MTLGQANFVFFVCCLPLGIVAKMTTFLQFQLKQLIKEEEEKLYLDMK